MMEDENTLRKRSRQQYGDLLQMSYPAASTRVRMSNIERAAQFSPFSALTGYEDAVAETARLTEDEKELDENRKSMINEKLNLLLQDHSSEQVVSFIYFQPDMRKSGGKYVTCTGKIQKIDLYQKKILLMDGTQIPIEQLYEIDSDFFKNVQDLW